MSKIFNVIFCFSINIIFAQSITLNERFLENHIRKNQLLGNVDQNFSFTIKPLNIGENGFKVSKDVFDSEQYAPTVFSFFNKTSTLKILPLNYNFEYNSNHPYKRNNGSMIPNRGFQHLLSFGFFLKLGPLSIKLKPEYLNAENKDFQGFWTGHYDIIWNKRYRLWNYSDIPERFGEAEYKKLYLGQSSIKFNFKNIELGVSSENLWWGPSIRNSIMMSNNALGFNHITFNSSKPVNSIIGSFEWQFVTGRLENSGFKPPETERTFQGTINYVPKINQIWETDDWRYFQGYIITYNPKWVKGLSLGVIRWVQMYSALVEGKYTWMKGSPNYFPLFSNIFRSNDLYEDYEAQTDQAAGIFWRWIWSDSNAEIYGEFHYNDSKQNIRDLLLDSDHSRAFTLGLQKIFKSSKSDRYYHFKWEWTKMEQTGSRLIRDSGSWYAHQWVKDGYTNRGEVMGSAIGPGSNSQFFSFSNFNSKENYEIGIEIIDNDNDFYYLAFEDNGDFRKYWKDYNLHFIYEKKFLKYWINLNAVYSRSLNYQWELQEIDGVFYQPGKDVNNFHINFSLIFPLGN